MPVDALSAAAIDAALPPLVDSTADLVGWAARAPRRDPGELLPTAARRLLAAALGVDEGRLSALSDAEVRVAVERLRAVAEQCRRLAAQATLDELTGALRRGAGLAALQREIDRTRRQPDAQLAVVFVDVDGLKKVNDETGHAAGDALLAGTVAAIRERLRSYDLVVRYGGDEFVCVLTGASQEQAERTAAVLRDQVVRRAGGRISTGAAALRSGDSVDSLIERADAALYAGRQERAAAQPVPPARGTTLRR
ncbi:MAG: GGDEF domain-containing protein [Candidatus Dormibacteria bacterium]